MTKRGKAYAILLERADGITAQELAPLIDTSVKETRSILSSLLAKGMAESRFYAKERTGVARAVVDCLSIIGEASVAEIRRATGLGQSTTWSGLQSAVAAGEVAKSGGGTGATYSLTRQPKRRLGFAPGTGPRRDCARNEQCLDEWRLEIDGHCPSDCKGFVTFPREYDLAVASVRRNGGSMDRAPNTEGL